MIDWIPHFELGEKYLLFPLRGNEIMNKCPRHAMNEILCIVSDQRVVSGRFKQRLKSTVRGIN